MTDVVVQYRAGTLADVPWVAALAQVAYQGEDIAIPETTKRGWYERNMVGFTVVEARVGGEAIRLGAWEFVPLNEAGEKFVRGGGNREVGFREKDLRAEHIWAWEEKTGPVAIYFENMVVVGVHLAEDLQVVREKGVVACKWVEEIAAGVGLNQHAARRGEVLRQGFAGCLHAMTKVVGVDNMEEFPIFAMPVIRSTELLIGDWEGRVGGKVVPGREVTRDVFGHGVREGKLSVFMKRGERIMGRV